MFLNCLSVSKSQLTVQWMLSLILHICPSQLVFGIQDQTFYLLLNYTSNYLMQQLFIALWEDHTHKNVKALDVPNHRYSVNPFKEFPQIRKTQPHLLKWYHDCCLCSHCFFPWKVKFAQLLMWIPKISLLTFLKTRLTISQMAALERYSHH